MAYYYKNKGREMRWNPEGTYNGDRDMHAPSLISLPLFCFLPPFFVGWWYSSGTNDFFFVSFFLL